jgi:hypothetical protein
MKVRARPILALAIPANLAPFFCYFLNFMAALLA